MENTGRVPLSDVVADCAKRWFKDTLKEAKAGDVNMQVLVSQMYYHGYGIPKDGQKVCCFGLLFFLFSLDSVYFIEHSLGWVCFVCRKSYMFRGL